MRIVAEPLTVQAFKPFGTVLEGTHAPVSLSVATVAPKGGLPLAVTALERHEHSQVSRYLVLATLDAMGTWHHPLTVLDGRATFAVPMWRDATAGDEEFVPVTTPLTVVLR